MARGTDLGSHLGIDKILECLLQQPAEQVLRTVITEMCKHISKRSGIIVVGHRVVSPCELVVELAESHKVISQAEGPNPISTTSRDTYNGGTSNQLRRVVE